METQAERFVAAFNALTNSGNYHRDPTADLPAEVFVWACISEIPGSMSPRGVRALGWLARSTLTAGEPQTMDSLWLYERLDGTIFAYDLHGESSTGENGADGVWLKRSANTIPAARQTLAVESALVAIEQVLSVSAAMPRVA